MAHQSTNQAWLPSRSWSRQNLQTLAQSPTLGDSGGFKIFGELYEASKGLKMPRPGSCDTFVALPPATANGCVVFGKNADRPNDEVQEVVFLPAADHDVGSKLECTYIEIAQVPRTHAVILSKPAWMWGAEMGANEHGVVIGNEAVWTKLTGPGDAEERLLGMDLLRLGLERSTSAHEAMDTITSLLQTHGQGGPCSEDPQGTFAYQNGFLIADSKEAWVLETVGQMWAAEKISSGVRNISNQLTIRTKIDKMSPGLKDFAQEKGWWKPGDGDFDFAKTFSDEFEDTELLKDSPPTSRLLWGKKLLDAHSQEGNFKASDMFRILRHEESGICMKGSFQSAASHVSVLPPAGTTNPACHWFTATPDPTQSLFKPFVFVENNTIGDATKSPEYGADDPAKVKPRFQKKVDRQHALWRAHEKLQKWGGEGSSKGRMLIEQMHAMEAHCVDDMSDIMGNYDDRSKMRVAAIFQHMVEIEMNFYK